jgi:hypothetical protein
MTTKKANELKAGDVVRMLGADGRPLKTAMVVRSVEVRDQRVLLTASYADGKPVYPFQYRTSRVLRVEE